MNLFLFLLFVSAAFFRIRSTAFFSSLSDGMYPLNRFFSGLSDGEPLFNTQHLINASNRKKSVGRYLSTAVRVVTADRVFACICIRSTAFFSGLSDGKPHVSILHLINASNRKKPVGRYLSTAVRVVTAERVFASICIRSTAFFSGLSDGKPHVSILHLINASNRKKPVVRY